MEPLDYVLSLAEAGLAEMRALIFELRPESLENEGLVAALTKQCDALRARHRLEIETSFCPSRRSRWRPRRPCTASGRKRCTMLSSTPAQAG